MVTLGTDSHKATHTVVATDEAGRQLGQGTFPANEGGHFRALQWAAQWEERLWALEDCRQLSRMLERDLLGAGQRVVRVPPHLMAGVRRSARTRGKSDPIDALAVARAALREPDLPTAVLEGPARDLRLLVEHREQLVRERARIENRLRWHLHELAPGTEPPLRTLGRPKVLRAVDQQLAAHAGMVADIAREQVTHILALSQRIKELEREIAARTVRLAPALLDLPGCASLTAAKIVGEIAGVRRFKSPAAFAMHNGTAPIPVWSGRTDRYRLNRGGNRQLNAALHRIAITQMRMDGPGKCYIAKRLGLGDSKVQAIRALRRRLSDEVYRRLCQDEVPTASDLRRVA